MDDNTAAAAVLVPIVCCLICFGGPIAAFVIFRVLAHRERMEMIRHGIPPTNGQKGWQAQTRPMPPPPPPAGMAPQSMAAPNMAPPLGAYDAAAQAALRKGVMLTAVGLALTIGLSFIGFAHTHDGLAMPVLGPWLLGGLVPLFVGLAQIAMALISGATLGNLAPPRGRQAWTPPPGIGAGSPGGGPGYADPFGTSPRGGVSYEESYTYRPGDTQELRRATPPPERMP